MMKFCLMLLTVATVFVCASVSEAQLFGRRHAASNQCADGNCGPQATYSYDNNESYSYGSSGGTQRMTWRESRQARKNKSYGSSGGTATYGSSGGTFTTQSYGSSGGYGSAGGTARSVERTSQAGHPDNPNCKCVNCQCGPDCDCGNQRKELRGDEIIIDDPSRPDGMKQQAPVEDKQGVLRYDRPQSHRPQSS